MDTQVLRRCPLFGGMDDGEAENLIKRTAIGKTYRRGETVHGACAPFERFGLVMRGTVAVYMTDLDGEEVLAASVPPGGTFGEAHCCLGTAAPPVRAVAREDCEILWFSLTELRQFPDGALRFEKMLAGRTLLMNDRIQILSRRTIREKILTLLGIASRGQDASSFTLPLTRSEMASYLGADRSAVSRELASLRKAGVLDYKRSRFSVFPKIERK